MRHRDYLKEYINLSSKTPLFELNNINYLILKDFSVQIWKGQKIAIVGPNGNGKSTFLNLISALYKYPVKN